VVRALAPDEVDVWFRRTESLTDAELAALDPVLSDDERARRDRLVFAADRRDFTAAHALLRQTLSRYATVAPEDWRFEIGPYGKPALPSDPGSGPALSFNLAHTRGLIACVVARRADVGVDVEQGERASGVREIAERFFAEDEIQALEGRDVEEYRRRFLDLWTLKEAYLKAVGAGLNLALPSFACLFDPSVSAPESSDNGSHWSFWLASVADGCPLAVAVCADVPGPLRVSFHDVDGHCQAALRWSSAG
jgi:4'-phosphopantetheinyl transferase